MAPIKEIAASLYGTFRLAKGDVKGLDYFNTSVEGLWRSFTAAMLVAPPFIILLVVRYLVSESGDNLLRFTSIHAISYAIGWVAFPLLIFYVTDTLNKGQKFITYIVVYNWASVLQNILYLPFAILVEGHLLQGSTATLIGVLLLSLVFFYTWFVTKTALEISSILAVGFVFIDLMLSIFINSISQGMLRVD
ncbi:MAG: hypothetical protein ACKVIK_03750 [Rhodospirillales bacterium]|jgi:hypothetical protein